MKSAMAMTADTGMEVALGNPLPKANRYLEALAQLDVGMVSPQQLLIAILTGHYVLEAAETLSTRLLAEFGSFTNLLNASRERVLQLTSLSYDAWLTLQMVRKSITIALKEPIQDRPFVGNWASLNQYLVFAIGHETVETVHVFFLDARNCLIKDEMHSRGTATFTAFNPRQLVERACELRASAMMLVHNHPSGDVTPSSDDVTLTGQIEHLLKLLNILFHDHLIVGKSKTYSFRQHGHLE